MKARISAALALAALVPAAALATPRASLRTYEVGGVANGNPYFYHVEEKNPAAVGASAYWYISDTGAPDGSYAHALGTASFGALHSYSDSHTGTLGVLNDVQSSVETREVDYVLPGASSPTGYANYTLKLAIHGSHSLEGPNAYYYAGAQVTYDIRDAATGDVFAQGYWDSTDATQSAALSIPVNVPSANMNDYLSIEINLTAFTHLATIYYDPALLTAVSDYGSTVGIHLDTSTPGASTTGVSGYNYATPAAVAEPGALAFLGVGAGFAALRRRRS